MSSGVSFTDKAATLLLKFSIFVVPGMGRHQVPGGEAMPTPAEMACTPSLPPLHSLSQISRHSSLGFLAET